MFKKLFAIAALVSIGSGALYAQANNSDEHNVTITIPAVALIDLVESTPASLTYTAPANVGESIQTPAATNGGVWLNISSVLPSSGASTRVVNAYLSGAAVPAGIDLKVATTTASAGSNGGGTTGAGLTTATSLLSSTSMSPVTVVSGITSCYTGTGSGSGYALTYSTSITNYSLLKAVNNLDVEVSYVMTDVP